MAYLKELGIRLRAARKKQFPKDTQTEFGFRFGVGRITCQKMEQGDLSVSMKHYYAAAELLKMQSQFSELFKADKKEKLFDN